MRILLVCDTLKHIVAQAEAQTLFTWLDPARIQLYFCQLRPTPLPFPTETATKLPLTAMPYPRFNPATALALAKHMRAHQIEAVHALEPRVAALVGLAGRMVGVPTLASYHDETRFLPATLLGQLAGRLAWRASTWQLDQLILPYQSHADALRLYFEPPIQNKKGVLKPARWVVINPGIAPLLSPPAPNSQQAGASAGPLIMLVGEAEGRPSAMTALEVCRYLLKRKAEVRFLVAGDAAFVAEVKAAAPPILPITYTDPHTPFDYALALADVVWHCASRDSIPHLLIRAALAGKPIVAARLPAIADILETNVSGLLVEPEETSDYSAQLSRVLSYEGMAERLGRMARQRTEERFTFAAQRDAYTQLYESTIYAKR
jgi:glycosyltransferase involved in cell wall biosynthesis